MEANEFMRACRLHASVETSSTGDEATMSAAQPLSRRAFLRGLLSTFAGVQMEHLMFRSLLGDQTLLAEAAELSRAAITVDLHCHPNLSGSKTFAEFDSDIPDHMRSGGLDAGVFAVRGDHGTIRRSPSGH